MSTGIFDNEWKYLVRLITLFTYAETYEATANMFLQRIKTLIPYNTGLVFQASRENGEVILSNPITTESTEDETGHSSFLQGKYPHWNEYLMSPSSSVFLQSDIIPDSKWETTRVYRELWAPKNNFYGLFFSLVHNDIPLAIIGLLREREKGDYSARDLDIADTLKEPLERKFFSFLASRIHFTNNNGVDEIVVRASQMYNLTKRECDVVSLACRGATSEAMCEELFITHATLAKHFSNIYKKTKVRSRAQLFSLLTKNFT